jgi:hypothetical protein
MRVDRLRGIAPTVALVLGVAYLVLTRLLLAWNGIIGADGARDLAMASRILHGQEFPLLGPLSGHTFQLGPLYYFMLALPLALFRTATGVISFLALLTLLSVFFAYRVGTLLFDRWAGFLFACLLAGDFNVALAAFQISNSDLILPTSLALVYTTLLAVVHRRPGYLTLALPLAAVALQIHPATVSLFPLLVVAVCLPTERGKPKALVIGSGIALILLAPYLAYELLHHGDNVRRIIAALRAIPRAGGGPHPFAIHKLFWWAIFVGPRAATHLSEGVAPLWLRHLALVILHAVAVAALVGLGLTVAGLFHRQRRWSCALLLCWFLPWWVIIPRVRSALYWWYLYPIQPAFLLFAALAIARLSDRLPLTWRWRAIFPYAFGLFAFMLPAWLSMAAFQRTAKEGLLRLPASLLWQPEAQAGNAVDFIYPSIGIRQEERLTKTLLEESGCDASLPTGLHGHPLWLTLQSRGVLVQLHQPRCRGKGDPGHMVTFIGMRKSDLPPVFRHAGQTPGPLLILRQTEPGPLRDVRYSDRLQSGWEMRDFDDSAWTPLRLPALQPPDPVTYPPPPDMIWPRSPIYIRARLRYSGTGAVFLGVAFPSAAPWFYQGRAEEVLVNGKPSPPPRLQAAYLLLYDLGSVLAPGENLVALVIGGAPQFTLDLFALTTER